MRYGLRKILLVMLIVLAPPMLNGCVWLAVGSVGALGGYVISPDTVEGAAGRAQEELWASALEIASIMGRVTEQSKRLGMITAAIGGAKVTINIVAINTSTSKVRVKARKAFLPKIALAQDVYTKIIQHLDK